MKRSPNTTERGRLVPHLISNHSLLLLRLDLDDLLLDHPLEQPPLGLLLVRARLGAGLAPGPRLGPAAALAALAATLPPPSPPSAMLDAKS